MSINSLLHSVDGFALHIWIGLGVGVAVSLAALVFGFRTWREPKLNPAPAAGTPTDATQHHDPFALGSPSEKRRAFRRKGRQVEVFITDKEFRDPAWRGYVLDRSAGGVRLSSDKPADAGQILNVQVIRPANDMPWIELEIIHCKPLDNGWELGCKFVRSPTWNLLLTFG